MEFIKNHLKSGSYRTTYCDTDSMCLATTQTLTVSPDADLETQYRAFFDPIVRPEMRDSWEANWKSWFVTTEQVEDQRFPGKLKLEFSMNRGHFVALAPKTYMAYNADDPKNIKLASKGVPHTVELTIEVKLLVQIYLLRRIT